MNLLRQKRWSPYLVGTLIGVLSWLTFTTMDKALGVSTTFVNMAGSLEQLASPEHVQQNEYFAKHIIEKSAFDWQAALVLALFFGAFIARKLSGEERSEAIPSVWEASYGPSKAKRALFAFIGGALVLFGARLAGGCTSGHCISGGLQLAVSGWVFMIALFAVGIPAAMMIYKKRS